MYNQYDWEEGLQDSQNTYIGSVFKSHQLSFASVGSFGSFGSFGYNQSSEKVWKLW